MPKYQRRTSSLLKQTGQVLYQTKTCQPSPNFKQKFSLQQTNALLSEKNLPSTKKYSEFAKSKFNRMGGSLPAMGWNKWKLNGFPDITKHFHRKLTTKTTSNSREKDEKTTIQPHQLKLRLKIREVMRLKTDILQTRKTNELIRHIEDAHESRIQHFFDKFQEFIDCNN